MIPWETTLETNAIETLSLTELAERQAKSCPDKSIIFARRYIFCSQRFFPVANIIIQVDFHALTSCKICSRYFLANNLLP